MENMNFVVTQRVKALRDWMIERGLSAFIVPTVDPHNSEYLPDHWKTREWLSGFTGSAGVAVVTLNSAALWTDSRYFLQAEEQLKGTPFKLMREGDDETPSVGQWLNDQFHKNIDDDEFDEEDFDCSEGVGYWGEMMSLELFNELDEEGFFDMVVLNEDPFDKLWKDRPALPIEKITLQKMEYAGMSVQEKLNAIRSELLDFILEDCFFYNDISEIAWLLNLRGNDIAYNPFFLSYLLVTSKKAVLFVDKNKLTQEVKAYLKKEHVEVCGYSEWKTYIKRLSDKNPVTVNLPINSASRGIIDFLEVEEIEYDLVDSELPMLRAVKNKAEQAGFRQAMLNDGVAMVKFLRWLDENVAKGGVTEIGVDKQLTAFRAEQPGFRSLSFATIAAYADHGAIVHYEAEPETDVELQPKGLLLLDSGAHYECGTTDITRTIALGELTEEERRVYTLVLKGHIALARCHFPEGTTGLQLDTAARYAMWQAGYDFGHGTGHGVGSYLGVHEGPHQIRKNNRACTLVPFVAGMTVTDEPGIYVTDRFGVRIENVLLTQPSQQTDFGKFLEFENLTLCPYDMRAVELSMLTAEEKQWINDYHARVRETLLPKLDDEADRKWLEEATKAI